MRLLQLQVVTESRGGQRQVVGRILLLQSAQGEVTSAQVGLAGTAPEHNRWVPRGAQTRITRNRQVTCGRQSEGAFLLLNSCLMGLLRGGTVLSPTAKEMQKHQQRRRRRHQQKEPHAGHQRNNQTHHNRQAHAQQNLLELTRHGRVHDHRLKRVAGVAQGSERLRGLAGILCNGVRARLLHGALAVGAGGGEHAERGAEAEGIVPAQDARSAVFRCLATLARDGACLNPADAGAIGVETTVYRLEEGVLQVNMARLFSSAGS